MSSLSNTFAAKAGVAILALATLTGCATSGFSPTPRQAREIGQGACTIGGAAAGAAISQSGGSLGRVLGAAIGGYGGRQICGAAAEAAAATRGNCVQKTVQNANGTVTTTSTCSRQTDYPGSVPRPQ